MALPVHVELVHDPFRHRAVIGWSADPILVRVTAEQLLHEAEERAREFEGIDDLAAARERAEVERLRRVLALLGLEEEQAG
jgi:hypothetical protein